MKKGEYVRQGNNKKGHLENISYQSSDVILKGLSSEQNIMLPLFNQLVLCIYLDPPRLNYRKICSEGKDKSI